MRCPLFIRFLSCNSGVAAAEMALVTPILIVLMFGSLEMGNFFLQEHVVTKAVRDGARFAARQPFREFPGCVPSREVERLSRNVVRTGVVENDGPPRLAGWTNGSTVTVSAACKTDAVYDGIYAGSALDAPVVTVTASVPYLPLFVRFGLYSNNNYTLSAQSQAAVTGI
jgi:hypothetical protein